MSRDLIEREEWLIRKGGFFYRPNCQGYTTIKAEAGRYTKAKAEAEASVEPFHMKAVHQDDVPPDSLSARIEFYEQKLAIAADRIAALEADGWQTIDTAPKDRRILLGRFSGDKKDEYDTYCAVDRWRHLTAGYSYTGWGQFNATHWPPTHWREIGRPA